MARYISAIPQYFDDGGDPLIAGELWFYESGTNGEDTLLDLFFDANMTIPGPNPAILSGAGRVPNIFFSGIANVILKDSEGVELWQADPVGDSGSTSSFETWSSLLIYGVNDVVQGSDFELYQSITSGNINNDPTTTPSAWEGVEFISKWNEFVTYQTSDISKGSNGFIYRSLQDNNIGNDPLTEPTWWGGTQATGNPDGSILLTKMVVMDAPNMIGRSTAGTGPQEEITPTQVRANINVEDGATANSTDAFLLDRTNHTGTQLLATISDAGTLAALDSVSATEIATDAVTSDAILADAVGPSELAPTTVTPDTYTNATVEVDQEGRILSASNGAAPSQLIPVIQVNEISGTYTPTAGMVYCVVEAQGAGGGAGASTTSTAAGASSGAGAGGYCKKVFTAADIGVSQDYVIGAKGVGGVGAGSNGTDGGNTTFGVVLTASGGVKGLAGSNSVNTNGGLGGAATGGDVNIPGQRGGGVGANSSYIAPAMGGNSFLGFGGSVQGGGTSAGLPGEDGVGYGSGGSGATAVGTDPGGDGADGVIMITEYITT